MRRGEERRVWSREGGGDWGFRWGLGGWADRWMVLVALMLLPLEYYNYYEYK